MSGKKGSGKNNKPLYIVIAVALVLFIAAGALSYIEKSSDARQRAELKRQQELAQNTNDAIDEEYAVALSDFEQEQDSTKGNLAWPAVRAEGWDVIDLTNYPLENPFAVSTSRQSIMNNGMLLVNEWHSRPEDFDETGLVSIGTNTDSNADNDSTLQKVQVSNYRQLLFPNAIVAVQKAISDAHVAGFDYYIVDEGYRSYADQEAIFNKYMAQYQDKYSGDALIERVKKTVNYPGTSEFNSGLGFTMKLYKKGDKDVNGAAYVETEQGQWMNENCWKYGIVFRFPLADYPSKGYADKSYKTGVSTKLRCYRYVGEGNAAAMHTLDMCLEEYIEYLMEHPHIAVYEDGILRYEISRQYVGDAADFDIAVVSRCADYTASLDNMGYAVVVMKY